MSRIGKQIIEIPSGTTVTFENGVLTAKGPKGELTRDLGNTTKVNIADNQITFEQGGNTQHEKAMWGTVASHVKNMIDGVNTPYEKKLVIEGVGFKSEVKGDTLVMALGFSHDVEVKIPEGLTVTAEKNVITITGVDKELVGQFAGKVRAKKKPEPYKGKGIRYEGEYIRRKQGKKTA